MAFTNTDTSGNGINRCSEAAVGLEPTLRCSHFLRGSKFMGLREAVVGLEPTLRCSHFLRGSKLMGLR
ncbi:hypothetical protein BC829DRAFT_444406 [Chytridium lagenaria]|nr:hypothetical protein BC829DRAFT_444406 [Chytridium lagenaria]